MAVETPSPQTSKGPQKQPPPKRSHLSTAQLSHNKYPLTIKENKTRSDQITLSNTPFGHWGRDENINTESQIRQLLCTETILMDMLKISRWL